MLEHSGYLGVCGCIGGNFGSSTGWVAEVGGNTAGATERRSASRLCASFVSRSHVDNATDRTIATPEMTIAKPEKKFAWFIIPSAVLPSKCLRSFLIMVTSLLSLWYGFGECRSALTSFAWNAP